MSIGLVCLSIYTQVYVDYFFVQVAPAEWATSARLPPSTVPRLTLMVKIFAAAGIPVPDWLGDAGASSGGGGGGGGGDVADEDEDWGKCSYVAHLNFRVILLPRLILFSMFIFLIMFVRSRLPGPPLVPGVLTSCTICPVSIKISFLSIHS